MTSITSWHSLQSKVIDHLKGDRSLASWPEWKTRARGTRDQEREEYTTTWTIVVQLAPDGTVHGELNGFFITASRGIVRYVGMGDGLMNPDGSMMMRGTVSHLNPTGKHARYNGMTVVWEFDVDKEGNMNNKRWEWNRKRIERNPIYQLVYFPFIPRLVHTTCSRR